MFDFDAPEDVAGEGGGYLDQPGTYHFNVIDVVEGMGKQNKNKQRSPMDGFTVELECLAGTVKVCEGKSYAESLFRPDVSKSEASQLANRRAMAAFFIACDLMAPSDLGKGVQIDLAKAIGSQLMMRIVRQMEKDGDGKYTIETKFLQLDYAAIFHVDDPEVAGIPKSSEALELIDKSRRHDASWFAFKERKAKPVAKPSAAAAGFGGMFD